MVELYLHSRIVHGIALAKLTTGTTVYNFGSEETFQPGTKRNARSERISDFA
jgi:hypothetical protein